MVDTTKTPSVYELVSEAIAKNDTRVHRHVDASRLKEYFGTGSDAATLSDDDWANLATAAKDSVTRKKQEAIDAAVQVLDQSVNGGDKDLVVKAMGSMHTYLLNELATAVMDAINEHKRHSEDNFDGRIGMHFQRFIKEYFILPARLR